MSTNASVGARITTARAEDPADSFLKRLRVSSAEIRSLMRHVLGRAPSGRTLKRLAQEILEKGTVAAMKEGMQTPEINALVSRKKGT